MTETTVVTASDANYAWGVLLLVASMRMNGMEEPVVVGTYQWPEIWQARLMRLPGVALVPLDAGDRRCVCCQKPLMMLRPEVRTPWITWADCDGLFRGNCSDLLTGHGDDECYIRRYDPPPADFTPETLAVWQRDVGERVRPVLATRVNTALLAFPRTAAGFLCRWRDQMLKVLPSDVGIVMRRASPYFQTDESVLASLLCFAEGAPRVTEDYRADGSFDPVRYFAHFAYNPKPWKMWNPRSIRWHGETMAVVDWLLEQGIVDRADLPFALRRRWRWLHHRLAPLALTWTRIQKLRRRLGL